MENLLIDKPKEVRNEDQLDLDTLKSYLAKEFSITIDSITLKQFSGGASNLTYQITINEKEYILRCPPKGTKAKGAHDMARESKIMSVLAPYYPYVPKIELHCKDTAIIGRVLHNGKNLRNYS
jgi:aminoglycoside phosphotransferase (APT) family kinase protein